MVHTTEIDLDVAVAQFLDWAGSCAQRNLTAREIMHEILTEYQNTRIADTDLQKDNDMLLFQWGNHTEYLFSEPTNLRNYVLRGGDAWLKTIPLITAPYLNFTRQLVAGENDDAEFDDVAIQMSITLLFEDETEMTKRDGSNLWLSLLSEDQYGALSIDSGLKEYLSLSKVVHLLDKKPSHFTSNVGGCG
jgi:hypothetical protein